MKNENFRHQNDCVEPLQRLQTKVADLNNIIASLKDQLEQKSTECDLLQTRDAVNSNWLEETVTQKESLEIRNDLLKKKLIALQELFKMTYISKCLSCTFYILI